MDLASIASIIAVSFGIGLTAGLTIGLLVAKNGVVSNIREGISGWATRRNNRKARQNNPYSYCWHVVTDLQNGGAVCDYFEPLGGFGLDATTRVWQCRLCGERKGKRDYVIWLSVVLPGLQADPERVRERLALMERLIRQRELNGPG